MAGNTHEFGNTNQFTTDNIMNSNRMKSSGVDVYKDTIGNYANPELQQQTTADQQNLQSGVVDAYDEAAKRQASSGQYGRNIAKDPSTGRLNNMSFNDTLARSRLADAFNNRRFYYGHQGGIGARGFAANQGPGAIDLRDAKQIQTQEMRQMRADEGIDAYTRQRAAGLSADAAAHSLELRRTADQHAQNLASMLGTNVATLQKQFADLNTTLNWENPVRLAQSLQSQEHQQRLAAIVGEDLAAHYVNLIRTNSWVANILGKQLGYDQYGYYEAAVNNAIENELERTGDLSPNNITMMMAILGLEKAQGISMAYKAGARPTLAGQQQYLKNKLSKIAAKDKETTAKTKQYGGS